MTLEKEYRAYFPEKKVFISRDHNWAFSAWEIGRFRNYIRKGATVVHIDNHLDLLEPSCEFKHISNEKDAISYGRKLGIDEFIKPALKTGTVSKVFMISDDSNEIVVSENMWIERAFTLNHFEHCYKRKWFDLSEVKSVILDLDLDFFNCNYKDWGSNAVLLPESIIIEQLNYIKDMFEWNLVTVALSPEHCGGEEQSTYLFDLFLEVFGLDKNKLKQW